MHRTFRVKKKVICNQAITFCRVSSKKQRVEGVSLNVQENAIRDYCKQKNLKIIKEYSIDESSMKGDRKQYHEMLDFATKVPGPIAIVVYYVDRLQRNFDDSYLIDSLRKKGKIEVHFIKEGLIIHKNSNSMELNFWNMYVLMANSQVNNSIDKIKGSIRHNKDLGMWQNFAPFGWINARDEDHKAILVVDPVRAPIIKTLFREFSSGKYSTTTIWELAKQLGLFSKFKTRKGLPVSKNTVYDILTNPFYYGMMYNNAGELIRHQYEPLITKEEYDTVQEVLIHNGHHNRHAKDKNSGKEYIFRGLIFCKKCGCLITPETKEKKPGQEYVYLRCGHSKKTINSCSQGIVNEKVIINQLNEELFNKISVPVNLQELLKKKLLKDLNQMASFNASMKANNTNLLTALKQKEDKLLDFYLESKLDQTTYDCKKEEIDAERRRLEENNERFKTIDSQKREIIIKIFSMATNLKEIFNMATISQKKEMLKLLLKNCKLDGKRLEYELRKPFDMLLSCSNFQEWPTIALNHIDDFDELTL